MPAGNNISAGIDEAGRGCLAGPVAAAAVILPQSYELAGLDDSKKLSPARREILAPKIKKCAVAWGIGVVWPRRIDEINILRASLEAMALATAALKARPHKLLIDGNQQIPHDTFTVAHYDAPFPVQEAIIGGDGLIPAIAAASILAKTFRDRLMCALARRWPGYGFEKHKGYGTREHLEAITRLGACPMHRLTFRGVKPHTVQNTLLQ